MNRHGWRINNLERDHTERAIQVNTILMMACLSLSRALTKRLAGKHHTVLGLLVDSIGGGTIRSPSICVRGVNLAAMNSTFVSTVEILRSAKVDTRDAITAPQGE
jgi:hypothetical protein